jgi:hypothetical protein
MADIPSTANSISDANSLTPGPSETATAVQKASDLKSNLENIIKNGQPWPQTTVNPGLGNSIGFLPPLLIAPNKDFKSPDNPTIIGKKLINYEFEDWLGQKITNNGLIPIDTRDRFEESKNLPKNKEDLKKSPYSTRDNYLIFNDSDTDYFKHGLQILNHLTPIENPIDGRSNLRLSQFKNTPFENQDPIIFGFEIVIDGISSPLLNGSVADFLNNYNMISEIRSKIPVYEDFKQQFIKFFKTVGSITINNEQVNLSKTKTGYANSDSPKSLFQSGRQAYMSHYLKKVDGLNLLTESNTADKEKYLVDYRKDVIKLDFSEDVSMSLGTLAHLYKLMYWSRPNGKNLVPENLLRFNCDIIVSEVRNFNRVKKAIGTGDLEVIKDNLSRYVYSLKECQFYFNSMPHPTEVDLSDAPKTHDVTTLEFDFKYSTVKFEKFMEGTNGFGEYIGYDGGAIWKVGNPGERGSRGTASSTLDTSIPKFYTVGGNKFRQNGVTSPFLINSYGNGLPGDPTGNTTGERVDDQENTDRFKDGGLEAIKLPTAAGIKTESTLARLKEEQQAKLDTIGKSLSAQAGGLESLKNNLKDPNFIDRLKDAGKKGVKSLEQNLKGSNSPMNFIDRLKESTKSNVKVQIANLVNNRVNLLSRTINKLGIEFVGGKGVRPPRNVYKPDLGALGNAMSNVSDRFFYDVRNDLTDFAGGALSSFLNGGISSFTKK